MAARTRSIRLCALQSLLQCGVSAAVLMVVCFGEALPRTIDSSAESTPVESTEVAIECAARPRVSDPRERDSRDTPTDAFRSRAAESNSPAHSPLVSRGKGHYLPNGLSAPLRC